MIIEELIVITEEATPSMTSVQSIGKIEYKSSPDQIRLFRRDTENKPKCICKIKRIKGDGWKMVPTDQWGEFQLPHFGNMFGHSTNNIGMKTHQSKIEDILRGFGVRYDSILQMQDQDQECECDQ